MIIGIYFLLINIVAFLFYGVDKYKAKKDKWRIPESTLLLLAAAGGSIGALLGMRVFHHKTRKAKFFLGVPAILILQLILAGVIFYWTHNMPEGKAEEKSIGTSTDKPTDDSTDGVSSKAIDEPTDNNSTEKDSGESSEKEENLSQSSEIGEPEESLVNPDGNTLETRIATPKGYVRTVEQKESLGTFIRNYKVEADGSPIRIFDGRVKKGSAAAVFSMYLGERDLQQCADTVMRMYAEYFRSIGADEKIAFHFVDGFLCDWNSYKSGKRVAFDGDNATWKSGGEVTDSDEAFESYLNTVFAYSSTLSLAEESKPVKESEIQIGDIFIRAGSPGHVVVVVDACEKDGKKAFLLGQGYMPAQQFHVLTNDLHENDPWYYEEEITYPFHTPEYNFKEGSLMRPGYIEG